MDDRDIKKRLSEELEGIDLSESRRRQIKHCMAKSLARRRLPVGQRLAANFREFWHSTFEISVAPTALSAMVAVSLLIFAVYPGILPRTKPLSGETVYLQSIIEQNGTQTVVYLPLDVEVIDNANN